MGRILNKRDPTDGLPLLRDDVKWLKEILRPVWALRIPLLEEYREQWLSEKQENASRRKANTWIRKRLESMTKEEYEKLNRDYYAPRCVKCGHFGNGNCFKFDMPVPEEHQYAETDCESYEEDIPF